MVKRALAALVLTVVCTGCLGTGGLGGKVKKFNLSATENRWGREGIFVAVSVIWVTRIAAILDPNHNEAHREKTAFFGLGLYGVRPCVSRIMPVQDVAEAYFPPVWTLADE